MVDIRHDPTTRRTVGAQSGKQSLSCLGVASVLDDLIKHITVLVDRSPQSVFLAGGGDDHLVQMPNVVSAGLLAVKTPRVVRAELLSHRRIVS